jgi:hypothetical protein
MTDTDNKTGDFPPNALESCLPTIADEIAENFLKSYTMLQTIRKYAIRQGASPLLIAEAGTKGNGTSLQRIDPAGLSQEILNLLANFLTRPNMNPLLAEAIRGQDIDRIRQILTEKCRSSLADGARNPRFRAIRTVLSHTALENVLRYRPGRGLYSKSGEEWACYAFSDDEKLDVIRGPLEAENYGNWPLPPFVENIQRETAASEMTQKGLVLEAARFFWNEATQRYGLGMVLIFELQRYMENRFPSWLMSALLHDPVADLVSLYGTGDEETPWNNGGDIPATSILWDNTHYKRDLEDVPMHKTALRLAGNWLNELSAEQATIFCMMYHCEYGSTETARKLGLGSPQSVDYHYKSCIKQLKDYCTRQEGLSPPDVDPAFVRLFFAMLHDVCTGEILKGGCASTEGFGK